MFSLFSEVHEDEDFDHRQDVDLHECEGREYRNIEIKICNLHDCHGNEIYVIKKYNFCYHIISMKSKKRK